MQNPVSVIRYFCFIEVTDVLIEKLATLAKLDFDPKEKEEIKGDLERMIQFINKLGEVNTENVKPMLHMSSNVNIMREDAVLGNFTEEAALKNASVQDGTFFKVPKLIKK